MPKRDSAPIGAPCWIDLTTSNPDTSRAFYADLFGWTSEAAGEELGGYITFFKDAIPVAGGMRNDPEWGMADVWSVYLATDDAEKTAEAVSANGGHVTVPPMPIANLGSMAVFTDPGGATVGTWQPGEHKGFGVYDEPGTAGWFELHTRDYEASVSFYRDVFRWETQTVGDVPEFRYTTLGEGDDALAGVMDASNFLPQGVVAAWSVYFRVGDADAALRRAVELGGAIVMPAEDTPYGRLAQAADPTGALFKVRQV